MKIKGTRRRASFFIGEGNNVFRLTLLLLVTAAVLVCACGAPTPDVEQDLNGDREGGGEAVEAAPADTRIDVCVDSE